LLQFSSRPMAESHACTAQIVRSEVLESGLAGRRFDDMPDCFQRDPFSPHLPNGFTRRKIGPPMAPDARVQSSTTRFVHAGTGMVRICFPLPIKSARTRWSSRSWKSSLFNPTSFARRSPYPINGARIARPRLPRAVSIANPRSRSLAWSTLSQFPILIACHL